MKVSYYKLLLSLLGLTMLGAITSSVYSQKYPEWAIGPFKRYEGNPIMKPQGKFGTWESQNAYNPAVIVRLRRPAAHCLWGQPLRPPASRLLWGQSLRLLAFGRLRGQFLWRPASRPL